MRLGKIKGIIEALIFASSEPVSLREIAEILKIHEATAGELVEELKEEYEKNRRGIQIVQVAGGYHFVTNPDYAEFVRKMKKVPRQAPLSQAALETLAVIAYKQPVTRAEIEALRGVKVESSLNTLLERGLIEEKGRKEGPGRPILYVTSSYFLRHFGLNDLNELPKVEDPADNLSTEVIINAE